MASALLLLCACCSPGFVMGSYGMAGSFLLCLILLLPISGRSCFHRSCSFVLRIPLLFLCVSGILECGHLFALFLPIPYAREGGILISLLLMFLFCRKGMHLLPLFLLPVSAAFCCLALQKAPSPSTVSFSFPEFSGTLYLLLSIKKTLRKPSAPLAAFLFLPLIFLNKIALPVPLLQRMRAFGKTGHVLSLLLLFSASFLRSCAAFHALTARKDACGSSANPNAADHRT